MTELSLLSLHELIAPWPARCGLHIISGAFDFVPALEGAVSQFIDAEQKIPSGSSIGPVYWVDSGNYFNAYRMAEMAKRRGIDPKMILRTLRIARPFTAFQLQQMLERIPQPTQERPRFPLVIISDLMGLFYDPEIQEGDLKRAYREFLEKMMKLKRRAVVLSLLLNHEVPPNRKHLLARVVEMADRLQSWGVPALHNKPSYPV